jgi:hypothetical protein
MAEAVYWNCTIISTSGKVKKLEDLWEGPVRMKEAGYEAITTAITEAGRKPALKRHKEAPVSAPPASPGIRSRG